MKNVLEEYKKAKDVFVPLVKRIYIGKIKYGTPYFMPWGFQKWIIFIRRLKLKPKKEWEEWQKQYPYASEYNKTTARFYNLPLSRRTKNWVVNIFGVYFYIAIGWPVMLHYRHLGWKDKYNTPRFEWGPSRTLFFFSWQIHIYWEAIDNNDHYWEMLLWYLYHSDEDLEKARETWPWRDGHTKQSTWDENYILPHKRLNHGN